SPKLSSAGNSRSDDRYQPDSNGDPSLDWPSGVNSSGPHFAYGYRSCRATVVVSPSCTVRTTRYRGPSDAGTGGVTYAPPACWEIQLTGASDESTEIPESSTITANALLMCRLTGKPRNFPLVDAGPDSPGPVMTTVPEIVSCSPLASAGPARIVVTRKTNPTTRSARFIVHLPVLPGGRSGRAVLPPLHRSLAPGSRSEAGLLAVGQLLRALLQRVPDLPEQLRGVRGRLA